MYYFHYFFQNFSNFIGYSILATLIGGIVLMIIAGVQFIRRRPGDRLSRHLRMWALASALLVLAFLQFWLMLSTSIV
jgi:hypothetical protein